VLTLESLGEHLLVEPLFDEVVVGGALAGEDGAADVDEREDEGVLQPLVLRLDVVGDATVFDVCVESGDHGRRLIIGFCERGMLNGVRPREGA
jgi:hypothetical protein